MKIFSLLFAASLCTSSLVSYADNPPPTNPYTRAFLTDMMVNSPYNVGVRCPSGAAVRARCDVQDDTARSYGALNDDQYSYMYPTPQALQDAETYYESQNGGKKPTPVIYPDALHDDTWANGDVEGDIPGHSGLNPKNYFPNLNMFNDPNQMIVGVCSCGCFEPATKVNTINTETGVSGWTKVNKIVPNISKYNLVSLRDDTKTVSQISEPGSKIPRAISEAIAGPESASLVVLHYLVNNVPKTLEVTQFHAILTYNPVEKVAKMVAAHELKVNDELVTADGIPTPITLITSASAPNGVMNVQTDADSKDDVGHVIFANHIVVGDLEWQNSLSSDLKKVILRQ